LRSHLPVGVAQLWIVRPHHIFMTTNPTVFVRWPGVKEGEEPEVPFEVVPRIGETIVADGDVHLVTDVVYRQFPAKGTFLYPVVVVGPAR